MKDPARPQNTIIDFITGVAKPNAGAEGNRQEIEHYLVKTKGYAPEDIEVDADIILELDGKPFTSTLDLVVKVKGLRFMVIKCAAGSLASREREVISAARLLEDYQIPLSIASDGKTAMVWDTASGNLLGQRLAAIPSKENAMTTFDPDGVKPMDAKRINRQKLIFKTYATRSCGVSH